MGKCLTIADCIARMSDSLAPITDTPRLEAELLLAHALGLSRALLLARLRDPVDEACVEPLLARRLDHEPLAYIFGEWEFFGMPFFVEPPLLVPRPETEHLVEVALKFLATFETAGTIADLCCGTGCVAVALGHHAAKHSVYACDIRADAVAMTQCNATRHNVSLKCVQGNLFEPLDSLCDRFDVVVSNPPYVPNAEWHDLSPVITKHEDPGALLSGTDGLDLIRRIIPEARLRLRKGGLLALEVGNGQCPVVADVLRENGFASVGIVKDLAGIERIISGIL